MKDDRQKLIEEFGVEAVELAPRLLVAREEYSALSDIAKVLNSFVEYTAQRYFAMDHDLLLLLGPLEGNGRNARRRKERLLRLLEGPFNGPD